MSHQIQCVNPDDFGVLGVGNDLINNEKKI